MGVVYDRKASIAWTWVDAIINQARVLKRVEVNAIDASACTRWSRLTAISAHHGKTSGCFMTVRLKIKQSGFKKIVDIKTWIVSTACQQRGHIKSLRSSISGSHLRRTWTASWAMIPPILHYRTTLISSRNGWSTSFSKISLKNRCILSSCLNF